MYISGYESSPSAGDAVCAFNGTGYTLDGSRVELNETVLCDAPVSLLSKRDGSRQEVQATPTTTITVTVWDRTQMQVESQISSVDGITSVYSSSWPEHGYTTTILSGSPGSSATETETSPVDSTTPICSNPWPESGHTATAVTVIPANPNPVPNASSTKLGAEDMDNEGAIPTFQPHIFMETPIEIESSDDSPYPTITTAIIAVIQTENDSSITPTNASPRETKFEPVLFKHSESESTRPWMIVSEEQNITTVSGENLTMIALLLVNKYILATSDMGRPTITFEIPFTPLDTFTLDTFTPSETETNRPWIIIDREEDVITVSGLELTGTALIVMNEPAAVTTSLEKQTGVNTQTGTGTPVSSLSFETWTGVDPDRPSQTASTTHSSGGAKVSSLDDGLFMLGLIVAVWFMLVGVEVDQACYRPFPLLSRGYC